MPSIMKSVPFLRLLRLVLLAVVSAMACNTADANAADLPFGKRPNIVLVMTDDQGYGDLACHGNPFIKTPHIDRFHAEAVRFTDFHVSPTCSPTRSALMTGRHEFRNGITHTILERERMTLKATTIAQVLKSAGYATGIFGKWHLGDEAPYQPDQRGFDEGTTIARSPTSCTRRRNTLVCVCTSWSIRASSLSEPKPP